MFISACQWGSRNAPRKALLIHGMTMCSNSWEGVAQLLVAEGFFVVAPDLLGHAGRQSSDYSVSALAKELRPFFIMGESYDVIIGHCLGGVVTLSLLPFLPKGKETTIALVDPAIELPDKRHARAKNTFLKEVASLRSPEEHMAEHPAWAQSDCMLRTLGLSRCDRTALESLFEHNTPWSFSGLFKNVPPNVEIDVLLADPKFGAICLLKHLPQDVKRLNARVLSGIGHWIQSERPDAIMDTIPLPRAKL